MHLNLYVHDTGACGAETQNNDLIYQSHVCHQFIRHGALGGSMDSVRVVFGRFSGGFWVVFEWFLDGF